MSSSGFRRLTLRRSLLLETAIRAIPHSRSGWFPWGNPWRSLPQMVDENLVRKDLSLGNGGGWPCHMRRSALMVKRAVSNVNASALEAEKKTYIRQFARVFADSGRLRCDTPRCPARARLDGVSLFWMRTPDHAMALEKALNQGNPTRDGDAELANLACGYYSKKPRKTRGPAAQPKTFFAPWVAAGRDAGDRVRWKSRCACPRFLGWGARRDCRRYRSVPSGALKERLKIETRAGRKFAHFSLTSAGSALMVPRGIRPRLFALGTPLTTASTRTKRPVPAQNSENCVKSTRFCHSTGATHGQQGHTAIEYHRNIIRPLSCLSNTPYSRCHLGPLLFRVSA